jgi:predicted RNA-binding Zn ribbon-like protein
MDSISDVKLIGGSTCLDFVNTIHDRSMEDSFDYIGGDYNSLLTWLEYADVWDKEIILKLQSLENDKVAKREVYLAAVELRDILFRLFSALADHTPLPAADLSEFNRFLSEALSHKKLFADHSQLSSAWDISCYRFDMALWPIIDAAYQVMIGSDYQKIKKCPACLWIFIDKSKGGRRRWCSMDTCGAIAKSRRYYHGKVKDQNQTK